MVIRSWHVGDVIRKLRDQEGLSATALARKAGVTQSVILGLERHGPEVEGATPAQWRVLDRIAAVFGLTNGAALYKLVPEPADPEHPPGSVAASQSISRVLPFAPRDTLCPRH